MSTTRSEETMGQQHQQSGQFEKLDVPGEGPIAMRDGKVGVQTGETGQIRWFDADGLRSLAKQLDVSRTEQHAAR